MRQVIRERIKDGRLPRGPLTELGFGHGVGQFCDGCGEAITRNQRTTLRVSTGGWKTFRLHDECFQIWDAERSLDRDDG